MPFHFFENLCIEVHFHPFLFLRWWMIGQGINPELDGVVRALAELGEGGESRGKEGWLTVLTALMHVSTRVRKYEYHMWEKLFRIMIMIVIVFHANTRISYAENCSESLISIIVIIVFT